MGRCIKVSIQKHRDAVCHPRTIDAEPCAWSITQRSRISLQDAVLLENRATLKPVRGNALDATGTGESSCQLVRDSPLIHSRFIAMCSHGAVRKSSEEGKPRRQVPHGAKMFLRGGDIATRATVHSNTRRARSRWPTCLPAPSPFSLPM